jgi:hypothetical protein
MSLSKLFEEFPNMDQRAVQDIFEDRGRDYNESVKAIKAIYGSESSAKNVYTQEALQLKEEQLIEQVKKESLNVSLYFFVSFVSIYIFFFRVCN